MLGERLCKERATYGRIRYVSRADEQVEKLAYLYSPLRDVGMERRPASDLLSCRDIGTNRRLASSEFLKLWIVVARTCSQHIDVLRLLILGFVICAI